MKITLYESELGIIKLTSEEDHLLQLDLNPTDNVKSVKSDFNDFVMNQLSEYFQDKRKTFDIPLKFASKSKLSEAVWNELLKIPYGETISYKELSEKIGYDKAWRAVGSAVGKNPIPIIIPCHRVLASGGKLGGFSLGLDVKKKLLKIEHKDGF